MASRVLALDTVADKSSMFFLDIAAKLYCVFLCEFRARKMDA